MNVQAIVKRYVDNMTAHRDTLCTGPVVDNVKRARGAREIDEVRALQNVELRYALHTAKTLGANRRDVRDFIEQTGL